MKTEKAYTKGSPAQAKGSKKTSCAVYCHLALTTILTSVLVVVLSILVAYVYGTGTIDLQYRATTSLKAFKAIVSMPIDDVKNYLDAYQVFEKELTDPEDEKKIRSYYRVINELCALGEVEKMYIPPVIDLPAGVYGNQLLFEEIMARDLDVGEGDKVLELGCGRGRIAHHVARLTGAKVYGLNIDDGVQLKNAIEYANETGLLGSQLEFIYGSYNDPLPFPDNYFDAFYHVQALSYAECLDCVLAELNRVLKPGAKLSFLDWFQLEAYKSEDPYHKELLRKTKAIIGAVYTPSVPEYHERLAKAGFVLRKSEESSRVGHQYPLIQKARDFFVPVGWAINFFSRVGALPKETAVLFNRLNKYVEDFIEADRLGLFTTSYWIVAQKPEVTTA